ncbi:hypothetical protein HDU89_003662 [Geranomyces variabilis]|nr:hypothetical protein HDU89_003662 [Geranomyces variabilis]
MRKSPLSSTANKLKRRIYVRLVFMSGVLYLLYAAVSYRRARNHVPEPMLGPGFSRVRAVGCDWVQQNLHPSVRYLKKPSALNFPLIDAWIKSDSEGHPVLADALAEGGSVRVLSAAHNKNASRPTSDDWNLQWDAALLDEAVGNDWTKTPHPISPHVFAAINAHGDKLFNKNGLVLGPHKRWLEALALKYGARHVSTLESPMNGRLAFEHRKATRHSSSSFNAQMLSGFIEPFDFAWSYSFLESEGIGNLDPRADVHHMARMLTTVKPGGFLFVGIPCCKDIVYLDSHRTYGPKRLASVLAGWRVVDVYPRDFLTNSAGQEGKYFQPMWVLQSTVGCANRQNSQASEGLHLESSKLVAGVDAPPAAEKARVEFDVAIRYPDDNLNLTVRTAYVHTLFDATAVVPQLAQLTPTKVDNRLGLDALIRDYVKLNNEARANPKSAKWIVMQCTERGNGGLGDRFKGIVSMFYYGVMTGRAFAIDWTYPDLLQDYLEPNMFDWRWQSEWGENRTSVYVDMLGEAWRDQGRMSLIRDHADNWHPYEIVRMRSRVDLVSVILQNQHWNETILHYSLKTFNRESIAGTALRALFRPSEAALENLERLDQQLPNYRKLKKVGLQFRAGAGTGEAAFDGDEVANRLSFNATKCFTAQGIQYALNQRLLADDTVFFLTGDTTKGLEIMGDQLSALGYKSFTTLGHMTHIDFAAHEPPNDHRLLHMRTYLDWLIMLDMDYMVTSRSGFGETAIYFTLDPSVRITKNKNGIVPPCTMQLGNDQADWVSIEGWNGDQHGSDVTHAGT